MAYTETCTKCEGTGLLRWGVIDRPDHKKSCWDCEGLGHKTFKTSPEDRALARARAQKKRDEALLARQEKRLAKQREITGGLTFAEKQVEREAQWAEEKAKAEDVPTGKITISGTILKVDLKHTRFGSVWKMTVKDNNGFVVWGSIPSIDGKVANCAKGDTITFSATVTPSDKDPKFGFFKRPTKATLTESTRENRIGILDPDPEPEEYIAPCDEYDEGLWNGWDPMDDRR